MDASQAPLAERLRPQTLGQALGIPGRSQQVGGLKQTGQFMGRDQGDPFRAGSVDDDDLPSSTLLPTGKRITPLANPRSQLQSLNPGLPDFPNFIAGQAMSTLISPDGKTLLLLTPLLLLQTTTTPSLLLPLRLAPTTPRPTLRV